jgi:hypothetical protein
VVVRHPASCDSFELSLDTGRPCELAFVFDDAASAFEFRRQKKVREEPLADGSWPAVRGYR